MDAKQCIDAIEAALKSFGEYSYYDKGADEVMGVGAFENAFKKMEAKDVAALLEEVAKYKHGSPFVQSVISGLDCMGEWFDRLLEESKVLAEYY